ncbi:hypothetical protein [Cohnella panacarvi]|uniref:hypothetical protein n=1 Tax=Cohnella panacarvi TaxID=400776 RepID=UPI000478FB8D|nr:hypothetical protein [Cohnella panacarvi]
MSRVTRAQAQKLVGQNIYAVRKDGSVVSGKLVRISGNRLLLEAPKGKTVRTKAIIPLVLFDLLAIGTIPFAGFGGFGGFGGYGGFGPYGGGFGGWW